MQDSKILSITITAASSESTRGDQYTAECRDLALSGEGSSASEALANLAQAIEASPKAKQWQGDRSTQRPGAADEDELTGNARSRSNALGAARDAGDQEGSREAGAASLQASFEQAGPQKTPAPGAPKGGGSTGGKGGPQKSGGQQGRGQPSGGSPQRAPGVPDRSNAPNPLRKP